MKPPRPASFLLTLAVTLFYLLVVLLFWWLLLILVLARRKWREGLIERLGFVPKLTPHPMRIWVHAISVGECEAAQPLVKALRQKYSMAEIVISTTTRTGRARAERLFPDLMVFHCPMDFPWAVWLALRRIRPGIIVQVEAEWWPSFLFHASRMGVPVCMVNVRITAKGARSYARIRPLFRAMAVTVRVIGVQDETYRDRLRALAVDEERIRVTGQMKYDNVSFERPAGTDELARELAVSKGEWLLVAGSTGAPGEEEILLDAYGRLKPRRPALRLAIVPRKPERFEEVARLISSRGFALVRRSQTQGAPTPANPEAVILGDTMGELMKFYALASCAFAGRSLVPMGGSNPIDPASLGLPLVFGPHMFNFPDAEELFVKPGLARVATDADSLTNSFEELLQSPDKAARMGQGARDALRSRQGATARNMELLAPILKEAGKSDA